MVTFVIKMKPGFDTKELWSQIRKYRVNLLVLSDVVWCYGEGEYIEYVGIIFLCRLYAKGEIEISLSEKEGGPSGKEDSS